MPSKVRGTHTFRASVQSRGAASNEAALSQDKGKRKQKQKQKGGEGKGKGKETGKGKGKKKADDIPMDVDEDAAPPPHSSSPSPSPSAASRKPASTAVSKPASAAVSASASASASVASKRKHSALDDGDSTPSLSIISSDKKQKQRGNGVALNGIKESLDTIGSSMRDYVSDRKQRSNIMRPRAETSPERIALATERLTATEAYLDPERMIALVDLISQNSRLANVYLSLEREDYRKQWITTRLRELGFVEGRSVEQ